MTGIMEDGLLETDDGSENAQSESMERADSIEHLISSEQEEAARLEEATLEPAAQVEAAGDYAQAEAIEAALTELIDSAPDQAGHSDEGGKTAFGQPAGDPSQHYSGVEMAEGEVVVDQDWNEGANAPASEEMGAEWSTSGDVDDRPMEEVVDGSMLGYVRSVDGGTTKADVATHDLGDADVERKGSGSISIEPVPGGFDMDHKPIPADEGLLNLDGKGGDVAEEPELKFDMEEGVIPKLDAGEDRTFKFDSDEGVWPKVEDENVWPKLEGPGGLVDFKFFKVETQSGEEGSLIGKDPAYMEGLEPSRAMEEALGRAVTDPAFRQELLDDSQRALAEYDLSVEEAALLSQIDPEGLEQVANQIKGQFETADDPAAQAVLGMIISNVLYGRR